MHLELTDSRRLTGPNLLLDRAGAVIDVAVSGIRIERVAEAWEAALRRLLDGVGWAEEETAVRAYHGGASLAFSAPLDVLYAATEVNEAAWDAAVSALIDEELPDEAAAVARLRVLIAEEENPALLRLREAARHHGVGFLADEDFVSVGFGAGSQAWPPDALPDPDDVDWEAVYDVPVVLVTGTNGKSTTVRLLARLLDAAGLAAGLTSTDFIKVGGEIVEQGDYSGPGGARTLLRDRRVEAGLLEVARGGMLRRGLAVESATAALITNVAEDHLGEYGIETLEDLTEAKFVVAKAVRDGAPLVLNADDAGLRRRAETYAGEIVWFSPSATQPMLQRHLGDGGKACLVEDDQIVWAEGSRRTPICPLAEIPITLGGAARHNVSNSLGAVALAKILGIEDRAIAEGLRAFRNDPTDNPGRGNFFEIDGVKVLVDFAHNPHGLAALLGTASRLPAQRRLLTLGQAGDRSDDDIRALARAAWQIRPDRVLVMGLAAHARGRPPGEVPALLDAELRRLGAPDEAIAHVDSCLDAAREALAWAAPGDLVLLLALTQRDAIFRLLREAATATAS